MENGDKVITPEEVIAKLKDDGDFDRLRLQIIQKLKDNEELRNSISTVVKQSSVLSRAGAENMKPRQLSDAIREDVGDRLMSQLSDGVWKIIGDEDGMRKEIKQTIQGVYNRMLNPDYKEEGVGVGVSSPSQRVLPSLNEAVNGSVPDLVGRVDETMSDNDVNEPPGFSLCAENNVEESWKERTQMASPKGRIIPGDFPQGTEVAQSGDCSDEDPDLPPGFG